MRKFFQKPSNLVPNAARQLLNQRLPDAPDPDCMGSSQKTGKIAR